MKCNIMEEKKKVYARLKVTNTDGTTRQIEMVCNSKNYLAYKDIVSTINTMLDNPVKVEIMKMM